MIRWGMDPDRITFADWLDVVWGWLMGQAPIMGDPARWKSLMYQMLWLGEEPDLSPEEKANMAKRRIERVNESIGRGTYSAKEKDAMAALMEKAKKLRGE